MDDREDGATLYKKMYTNSNTSHIDPSLGDDAHQEWTNSDDMTSESTEFSLLLFW